MTFTAVVLFVFVITAPIFSDAYSDIILKPPTGKSGNAAAIVFAQGASISTDKYEPLLTAIQDAVDFPLWVGIPQCYSETCSSPGTLLSGIDRVLDSMHSAGLDNSSKLFFGGHGLGGFEMSMVVKTNSAFQTNGAGMILMGSFLSRAFKTGKTPAGRPQVEFPLPTLTLAGELDGVCRVSRIAEALYTQITFSADPAAAARSLPVTVIAGMNHIQFASGTPPPSMTTDLVAEIAEAAAHAAASADAAAFLNGCVQGHSSSSWATVAQRVGDSTLLLQPLVDSLLLEGYQHFLPPCYCETTDEYGGLEYGTCVTQAWCQGNVPWTETVAQSVLAGVGVLQGLAVTVTDSIHQVTEESPSCHLPHIHKSQYTANSDPNANPGNGNAPPLCSGGEACTLSITTVTQNLYNQSVNGSGVSAEAVTGGDDGVPPIAALELRAKMKSRQAVWEAAGVPNVNFTDSDAIVSRGGKQDLCRQANEAVLQWAEAHAPTATLARFKKQGQKVVVAADNGTCAAGPCWIYTPLVWIDDHSGEGQVTVASIAFSSQNSNPFPCGENKPLTLPCDAGFHYCKLLSPGRIMEWMYVDGLRLHNTLPTSSSPSDNLLAPQ